MADQEKQVLNFKLAFEKKMAEGDIKQVAEDIVMDKIIEILENDEEIEQIIRKKVTESLEEADFSVMFREVNIKFK